MQNITKSPVNWSTIATRLSVVAIGLTVTVSGVVGGIVPANAAPLKPSTQSAPLPDGIYLYGESNKPDEIGKGYFVFESKRGQVVGALYFPRSSFDCAAGSFHQEQLSLTVTHSYDRTTNPFEIALDRSSTIASNSDPALNVGLQGFHKLTNVTDNDLRMLNVCKSDLTGQANAAR